MKSVELNDKGRNVLSQYGLDAKDLSGCHIRIFEAGEFVLHQDEPIGCLYMVIDGKAKVCVNSEDGNKLIIYQYISGGILGEVEMMLECENASTSVIAVTRLSCVAVPIPSNIAALKKNIAFLNIVGQNLSMKLLNSSNKHIASALLTSEQRLCAYILSAEHNGMFTEHLTDTAQSIGVSYRHIFRIMGRLCRQNILEKTEAGFKILDRNQLKKLVSSIVNTKL